MIVIRCAKMEFPKTPFDNSHQSEEREVRRRTDKRKQIDGEVKEYKSKNLKAERNRRQKLSERLLQLRSLVPNITNMTKETIITDAITYIRELQMNVDNLSEQLLEMEATNGEELETKNEEIIDNAEEMGKWGIEPEVQVAQIGPTKLWIKIVCQKKRGGFTKLMEAMNVLGFDLNDTSATASKGALLVTSSVEVVRGGLTEANQIREILLEIIHGIY
ncbi:transcription factor DYT1-like isoform X2 [Solanum dulcamara]|uniref:transcription factor DYT1-like isoform X2 n=1 Tax=Solanum dulcamara TaxID=45834 RepID=UPI002486A2D8|nr:transcription factor DYT1-like isoform X2 [Solanum dulcamara]